MQRTSFPQDEPFLLAGAIERYLSWLRTTRDLSPNTMRAYRSDLRALDRHFGGSVQVRALDQPALLEFFNTMRESGLASSTVRRRFVGVRGFSRWLQASQLAEVDPLSGVQMETPRGRMLPRAVGLADARCLLGSISPGGAPFAGARRWSLIRSRRGLEATTYFATVLMIGTGLRVGELTALRCVDCDVATGAIRVLGKGRRERTVYLTEDLRAMLTAYLGMRGSAGVGHDRLLVSRFGEPLTPDSLRRRLRAASARAGLSAHVTPHMLRHTAATQLVDAGIDIRVIQRLMGHASIATTEIYAHVSDATLARRLEDARVVERILEGG